MPYARFFFKEKDEIMNLTRLNLCSMKLFSELALWRQIYREKQSSMGIASEEKDVCKEIVV